jgi:hypothetical protein
MKHTFLALLALATAAFAQTPAPTPAPHSAEWLTALQSVKSLNYRAATQDEFTNKLATVESLLANPETTPRDSIWLDVTKVRILNSIPARREDAVSAARALVEHEDWIYPSFAAEILQVQGRHEEAKTEALRVYNKYSGVNADHALVAAKVTISSMRALGATPQEINEFARNALLNSGRVTKAVAATDVYKSVNPSLMTTPDYRTFLQALLRVVEVNEDTAKFLGIVKSQIEALPGQ